MGMFFMGFSAGAIVTLITCLVYHCFLLDNWDDWFPCGCQREARRQRALSNPTNRGRFIAPGGQYP